VRMYVFFFWVLGQSERPITPKKKNK
jgi:hypothetical protein